MVREEGGGRCYEATRAGNNTTRQRGGVALGSHGARPSPTVAEGVAETAAGRDDVSTGAPDELRPAVALAAGVTTTVPAMLPTPRSPSGVCRCLVLPSVWCMCCVDASPLADADPRTDRNASDYDQRYAICNIW